MNRKIDVKRRVTNTDVFNLRCTMTEKKEKKEEKKRKAACLERKQSSVDSRQL